MTGRISRLVLIIKDMEKIKIAKIVNVVGLKGEVKAYHYSDCKERFEDLREISLIKDGREIETEIEKVRYSGNLVILKLKCSGDRNAAESLRDYDIYITEKDLRELPEGSYYIRDLIGMKVEDEGEYGHIGILSDVIQNSAQDTYKVKRPDGKEILIPAVKEFIKSVDPDSREIRTCLIPGFIDEIAEN